MVRLRALPLSQVLLQRGDHRLQGGLAGRKEPLPHLMPVRTVQSKLILVIVPEMGEGLRCPSTWTGHERSWQRNPGRGSVHRRNEDRNRDRECRWASVSRRGNCRLSVCFGGSGRGKTELGDFRGQKRTPEGHPKPTSRQRPQGIEDGAGPPCHGRCSTSDIPVRVLAFHPTPD